MYTAEMLQRHLLGMAVGGYVPSPVNYLPSAPAAPAPAPVPVQTAGGTGFGIKPTGGRPLTPPRPGQQFVPGHVTSSRIPGAIGAGTVDQHSGPFYQNAFNAMAPISKINFSGANLDTSKYGGAINQAQEGYGNLFSMLQNQANGGGPNPAMDQLHQTTDRNIAQAHALQQSNAGNAGALRDISRQTSEANAGASGQAATMRAQQQLAAQSQLGTALGQYYGTSGQLQNQQNANNITNWLDPQRLALEQSQGNQNAFGNAQALNAQTSNANLAAAQQFQGQAANAVGGAISGAGAVGASWLKGKLNDKSGEDYTISGDSTARDDSAREGIGGISDDSSSSGGSSSYGDYGSGGGDVATAYRGGLIKSYAAGGEVSASDRAILDAIHGNSPTTVDPDVGEPTGGVRQYTPPDMHLDYRKRGGPLGSGGPPSGLTGGGIGGLFGGLFGGASPGLATGLAVGEGLELGTNILAGGRPIHGPPSYVDGGHFIPSPVTKDNPTGAPIFIPPQGIPEKSTIPEGTPPPLWEGRSGGGGSLAYSGGPIRGHAAFGGDNPKNDTVPTMLSPGEIVLPRSVTQDDDAAEKAAAFVEAIKARRRR